MKRILSLIFLGLTTSVIVLTLTSCAYKLSSRSQLLPGNVKRVQIPLFKNNSTEPGIEVFFTNALKAEALKSSVVTIQDEESSSDGILTGTISAISVVAEESILEAKSTDYLPAETVLATQYKVTAAVDLILKKKGSSEVLWSGCVI
jgi:Lipopolysaccharide-assembly